MDVNQKLKELKAHLDAGASPEEVSVADFLAWFGAQRRGASIVAGIRQALEFHSLETEPDFESAYIGSFITVLAKRKVPPQPGNAYKTDSKVKYELESDPTYRVSKLKAANNMPKCVNPEDLLCYAVTIMMECDFSQLPVMTTPRALKGLISWKSIGQALALGVEGKKVQDFMGHAPPILCNTVSIFSIIDQIKQDDCVIVSDKTKEIRGIITSADLSEQFGGLSQPFMTLGEIENRIRKLLQNSFDEEDFRKVSDRENGSTVTSVVDLSMGDYVRLIDNEDVWRGKLRLEKIDRVLFVKSLNAVREIRNKLMHFDPDGVESEDILKLNNFCELLRSLDERGLFERK